MQLLFQLFFLFLKTTGKGPNLRRTPRQGKDKGKGGKGSKNNVSLPQMGRSL